MILRTGKELAFIFVHNRKRRWALTNKRTLIYWYHLTEGKLKEIVNKEGSLFITCISIITNSEFELPLAPKKDRKEKLPKECDKTINTLERRETLSTEMVAKRRHI